MKKGITKMMIQTIGGVVLAAIILLALFYFTNNIIGVFFNTEKDNFDNFIKEINSKQEGLVLLSLDYDYVLGFNKDQNALTFTKLIGSGTSYIDFDSTINKPDSCIDVCICKCDDLNQNSCNKAQCETIKDIDNINGYYNKPEKDLIGINVVDGLYIEGKIKLPLYFKKQNRELTISDKQI